MSAEEGFAKMAYSVMGGLPELTPTDAEVINWARQHGFLNGANLTDVMDAMATDGMSIGGKIYRDGPPQSVDWTDDAALSSAIYQGPVKIAVNASQLEGAIGNHRGNGWVATGFRTNRRTDHCVGLPGFGTMADLCGKLGVPVPAGADPAGRCYLLYTWGSIGVIDRASLIAITDEAWLRTPTTPDAPTPIPVPGPTPTPTPTPTPSPFPVTVTVDVTNQTVIVPAGWTVQVLPASAPPDAPSLL